MFILTHLHTLWHIQGWLVNIFKDVDQPNTPPQGSISIYTGTKSARNRRSCSKMLKNHFVLSFTLLLVLSFWPATPRKSWRCRTARNPFDNYRVESTHLTDWKKTILRHNVSLLNGSFQAVSVWVLGPLVIGFLARVSDWLLLFVVWADWNS